MANPSKRALITGITGQDGSYLAELLLAKGYEVYGLVRRSSTPNTRNIERILPSLHLLQGDLIDSSSLLSALDESQPHEVYNLAAMSHVGTSFSHPFYTSQVNAVGVQRLFEAIAYLGMSPRIYQASTSEMYGNSSWSLQDEDTPLRPVSPYGISKVFAHHFAKMYRDMGYFVCCGILFNHESERRGYDFVTRKIIRGLLGIKYGLSQTIELGNLEASRDWGYAPDYVRGMWLMLQQDKPDDYVLATGESHTIMEFLLACANSLEMPITASQITYSSRYHRPTDIRSLCGDAAYARETMGWKPTVDFTGLVKIMCESEERLFLKENPTCHSKKDLAEKR